MSRGSDLDAAGHRGILGWEQAAPSFCAPRPGIWAEPTPGCRPVWPVYMMEFEDGEISHMTKIWNAGWAMKELGWIE